MGQKVTPLTDPSLVLIFAYAPAGLGHLRVMDALSHGIPKEVVPVTVGSQNDFLTSLHRVTSIHPIGRRVGEWLQQGTREEIFTKIYQWFFHITAHRLYKQIIAILDDQVHVPKTILVVATHYGLAHQLVVIKTRLEQTWHLRVRLIVQVTDDSPQRVWYIPGADLIVVPSHKTKNALQEYGRRQGFDDVRFAVAPYPISPLLGKQLSSARFSDRVSQVTPNTRIPIHIAIPLSGAAVGMEFFTTMLHELHSLSENYVFHIVAKSSLYTQPFLNTMATRSYVHLHASPLDRGVVDAYEQIYQSELIALEVTKPSEQAFKALLSPKHVGGSILLFSPSVGLQERDNLDFLGRHHFVPDYETNAYLWEQSRQKKSLLSTEKNLWRSKGERWRGLRIPPHPIEAAIFISWCIQERIFQAMMQNLTPTYPDDTYRDEIGTHGVERFWSLVREII